MTGSIRTDCKLAALVAYDRNLLQRGRALAYTPSEQAAVHVLPRTNGGKMGASRTIGTSAWQRRAVDPGRWFGHVELTSLKARTAVKGYGQSFYEINRGYVRSIWFERRPRYTFMDPK